MATQDNILDAFDRLMRDKNIPELSEGTVTTANENVAWIKFGGSGQAQQADYIGAGVKSGDRCIAARVSRNARWVIIGTYSSNRTSSNPSARAIDLYAPPTDLVSKTVPGFAIWEWQAPVATNAVAFEIQTNSSASETGATATLITRGSYYFESASADRYARVRMVTLDFKYSNWTSWVSCTPLPAAAPYNATYIVQTSNSILANEQALSALATGQLRSTTGTGVVSVLKDNIGASVAPAVSDDSDDGYSIGSRWYDTTADKEYVALDVTVGAAVWKETTITTSGTVTSVTATAPAISSGGATPNISIDAQPYLRAFMGI